MKIPLEKLFALNSNKYLFTKAGMDAIENIANITGYPNEELHWKVVPNILEFFLDGKIKYVNLTATEEEAPQE